MEQPTFTIARFTFFEAVRNRLFSMMVVGLICIFGLTEFVGELAITETKQTQAALMGAGLRIFAICVIGLFVITSMARDFNDKGIELLLSLPISRSSYYFGKFLGFLLLSFILAIASGAILLLYSEAAFVMFWLLSLFCELLIIVSLSLLCLFTFSNITVAFTVVISFYFLSRSMPAIQLISDSQLLECKSFSQEFINYLIDAIAFILPELNTFTQAEWLVYGADINSIGPVILQTIFYLGLLIAAGLFDLYRKDL